MTVSDWTLWAVILVALLYAAATIITRHNGHGD